MEINLPKGAETILRLLNHHGEEAYVVGGCVRDAIMNKSPHDWDICTSAPPDIAMGLFRVSGFHVIPSGLKHGTITVIYDGEAFEITTFRIDGNYSDGRHPDSVQFTSNIQEDLSRRDFTMNAIAYHPQMGLVDPFFGEEDIRRHIIRCVGEPIKRFEEDALRILRAVRFAATTGFTIEGNTVAAIYEMLQLLGGVAQERKASELMKILLGAYVGPAMIQHQEVIAQIIPELKACFGFNQRNPYHIYDVWRHTVAAVAGSAPDPVIRLSLLLHDISKPNCYMEDAAGVGHFHGHGEISAGMAKTILSRLRIDNNMSANVVELVRIHDRVVDANTRAVRRLLQKIGTEQFDRFVEIRMADIMSQSPERERQRLDKIANIRVIKGRVLAQNDCFTLKDLAVNGKDLITAGISPGPELGKKLNSLLDAVLDDPALNEREILLRLL